MGPFQSEALSNLPEFSRKLFPLEATKCSDLGLRGNLQTYGPKPQKFHYRWNKSYFKSFESCKSDWGGHGRVVSTDSSRPRGLRFESCGHKLFTHEYHSF